MAPKKGSGKQGAAVKKGLSGSSVASSVAASSLSGVASSAGGLLSSGMSPAAKPKARQRAQVPTKAAPSQVRLPAVRARSKGAGSVAGSTTSAGGSRFTAAASSSPVAKSASVGQNLQLLKRKWEEYQPPEVGHVAAESMEESELPRCARKSCGNQATKDGMWGMYTLVPQPDGTEVRRPFGTACFRCAVMHRQLSVGENNTLPFVKKDWETRAMECNDSAVTDDHFERAKKYRTQEQHTPFVQKSVT